VSHDPAIDRASLLALQRGDTSELNRIIARWQRPLFGFAYRYVQNSADAEDLVAETLARLHEQRFRLREGSNLSAWLFTTLTNLCHNHHRWKRRHPSISLEERSVGGGDEGPGPASDPQGGERGPDAELAHGETLAALREAVDALPHDLKATVLLHHYERLSYREIAAITGCSERGVETRLYRARQQLRQSLGAFLGEETRR
jgi:RNA polymerase sigma-70 factor (ECF subfamily)